jgi:EAL domain-containing protein (putative c-di-GMP-specific phosphodiesterase class I)
MLDTVDAPTRTGLARMPPDLAHPMAEPMTQVAPPRFRLETRGRDARAERRRLARDLAEAVRGDGFALRYLPRVALASGAARGAEAVPRWPHPRRGVVPPSVFLPLAEASGLIVPLGGQVLRAACREAARWPAERVVVVRVAASQLAGGAVLGQLATALEESALPPERLEIALAEADLLDSDAEMLLLLSAVRDLGVGLALDAFGAAHAALGLLRRLPLTALKLHRSLVRDLPEAAEDAAMVRAITATATALGLGVIAEGIETEAQRGFLLECGCELGQGARFGTAMPAAMLWDAQP